MSKNVISVSGLGKEYRIGARQEMRTFREAITDAVTAPLRALTSLGQKNRKPQEERFWALKDASFEVREGDVLGVIGSNGAGKSTLLKVLSRITEPTRGRVEITGKVGSLLEVGTGFHPELTGRENIFLNGAILGMGKAEIHKKFDEIVAFSEVNKFIDTPVKFYSSGMYLRLAFAVAAHLEPEILIVDEVLAVGDAAFQKKCLGKMGEVSREGRTIVFVSHNMTAVQTLCNRAIWLSGGSVIDDDQAGLTVGRYLKNHAVARRESHWEDPAAAPGNHEVRLHHVRIVVPPEFEDTQITVETPIDLEFLYWNLTPGAELNLSVFLYSLEDVCIFNVTSPNAKRSEGLVKEVCTIPAKLLNDGSYRIRLMIVRDTSRVLLDVADVLTFEVADVERQGNWYGKWEGIVRPSLEWRSEMVAANSNRLAERISIL